MATFIPNARQQFADANGIPLAGGSVGMYVPSTLTPSSTWQDSGQTTLNANPIPLDLGGFATIYGTGTYRQIVKDSLGNTIYDRVIAVPDSVQGVYLAAANGSDITSAINNLVAANPGQKIILPKGDFTHTGLNFTAANTVIEGYSKQATSLTYVGTPKPGGNIRFGPVTTSGGALVNGCGLRNLTLSYGSLDSTGVGLLLEQCQNFDLFNVGINHSFIGLDIAGCSNVFIKGLQTYYGAYGTTTVTGSSYLRIRSGYTTGGVAQAQVTYGVFIGGSSFTGVGTGAARVDRGILCYAVDGLYWSGDNYLGEAKNLWDWEWENASVYFANANVTGGLFDANNGQSVNGMRVIYNVATGSQSMNKIAITGVNFAGFTQYGIQLQTGQVNAMSITGCNFAACALAGIDIQGAAGIAINGNTFVNCGTAGNAGTGGIRYTNGLNGAAIVGNSFSFTPATAKEIVVVSTPTKLQQLGNATTGSTPIPVINT